MDYPDREDEVEVVRSTTGPVSEPVVKVISPSQLLELQAVVLRVPVADFVARFAVNLVRRTRPSEPEAPKEVRDYVAWGAGPRAAQHLVLASKASALLRGDFTVTPDHVRAMAVPVLGHRIVVNFHAEAERVLATDILGRLLAEA